MIRLERTLPILVLLWSAGPVAGCQAPREALAQQSADARPEPTLDAKARVRFEQIEPPVRRPSQGVDVVALSERAKQQIAKAKSLLADQRFTEAAIELERALRSDPNHPSVHAVLAELHLQAGNLDRARSHATRSAETNPDSAAVHYVLGRCMSKAAETAGALYELRVAMACSDFGQDVELAALCNYHLAELLAREGYSTAALFQYDEFEKVAAGLRQSAGRASSSELSGILGSPALVAEARARLLAQLGQYDDAAQVLASVVAARPTDSQLAVHHAELLMKAGRLDEAFDAVQKISSNDEKVIELVHAICERAGDPQRAVRALRQRLVANPNDADLALRFAEILQKLGHVDEAARSLEDFLKEHRSAGAVRNRLIELRLKQGNREAAVKLGVDEIGLSPGSAAEIAKTLLANVSNADLEAMLQVAEQGDRSGDFYLAGVIAAKVGRTDDAIEHLRRAIEIAEDFTAARVALGRIYLDQYRYDDVLNVMGPDRAPAVADAQRLLGQVYDRLDDLSKADQHYRAAIQLDRNDVESKVAAAELYIRGAENEQAQQQLKLVVQQHPDHERAHELLAITYFQDKKPDLAISEYRELDKRTSKPTTAARCRIMLDGTLRTNPQEARKVLLAAMETGVPDAATWLALAVTYEFHELAEQRKAYQNALALEPGLEDALLGLARVDRLDIQFESAAAHWEQLLRRRPNRHEWRRSLAELKIVMLQFDAALELVHPQLAREDLELRDRNEYRALYIKTLTWAKRDADIETQLKQWIQADPGDRAWTVALARHHQGNKNYPAAIEVYGNLLRDDKNNRFARAQLVVAMIAAKEYRAAAQHCLDWLEQDPDDDHSIGLLAAVLAESGQFDAAVELVHNRMLHTQNREAYQDWLIAQLSEADRHDQAIALAQTLLDTCVQVLREAVDGSAGTREAREESERMYLPAVEPGAPGSPDRLHQRAEVLRVRLINAFLAAREYRRAAERLEEWLENAKDTGLRYRYLRLLAGTHQMESLDEKAAAAMERALLLQPLDVSLNNDLSYVWIDRGIRLSEAEPLIRHALGNVPDQPAYLDTYAWLLYKKGDFEGARTWLTRANVARGEEDPVILDHLGDALWRLGRRDEAVAYWSQAIDLVKDREADDLNNPDERRVKAVAPGKVEAARNGEEPAIAGLAKPAEPEETEDGIE